MLSPDGLSECNKVQSSKISYNCKQNMLSVSLNKIFLSFPHIPDTEKPTMHNIYYVKLSMCILCIILYIEGIVITICQLPDKHEIKCVECIIKSNTSYIL